MLSFIPDAIRLGLHETYLEWQQLLTQPGAPSVAIIATVGALCLSVAFLWSIFTVGAGAGNRVSVAQILFSCYVRAGRARNLLCSPCDRCRRRYPMAATCQIPFFNSLSDLYTFVFGYRTDGLFVEVGAYDGESFSNTSGLADIGWKGHYCEPIPRYAQACAARHAGNKGVQVHTVCMGESDGQEVELSAAGPFSSAVDDEIASVSASSLGSALTALGWSHTNADARVKTTTVSLNTFFRKNNIRPGEVDVMVVDTEGFEWPILRGFNLAHYRPKLVIVEIQEKQARYRKNARVQQDAAAIERAFADAGYSILYRDIVNTVFVHRDVECAGGD